MQLLRCITCPGSRTLTGLFPWSNDLENFPTLWKTKRKNYVKAIVLPSPSQFIYFLVIPVYSPQVLSCVHTQVNWFHPRACLKKYKSDDRIPFLGDLLKFRASLYILGNAGCLCKRRKQRRFFLFLCCFFLFCTQRPSLIIPVSKKTL